MIEGQMASGVAGHRARSVLVRRVGPVVGSCVLVASFGSTPDARPGSAAEAEAATTLVRELGVRARWRLDAMPPPASSTSRACMRHTTRVRWLPMSVLRFARSRSTSCVRQLRRYADRGTAAPRSRPRPRRTCPTTRGHHHPRRRRSPGPSPGDFFRGM